MTIRLDVYKDIEIRKRILVLDSEAVGLLRAIRSGDSSSLHVICCKDMQTKESFNFFDPFENRDPNNREWLEQEGDQDGSLLDGIDFLQKAVVLIGHNVSGYDFLAFEKVFKDEWKTENYLKRYNPLKQSKFPFKMMDTYVMSTVLNPERKPPFQAYNIGRGNVGPHSIEAHGIRIDRHKPENEDWTKLTDHMIKRCSEDVEIGSSLYWYLKKEWDDYKPNPRTNLGISTAYKCELQNSFAIARQAERGFRLDTKLALSRVKKLDLELDSTESMFRPHMPKRLKTGSWTDVQRKKYYKATGVAAPDRCGYFSTTWELTKKDGTFRKAVTDLYSECRGNISDYKGHIVGPYTKVLFEDVPLGNRNFVKQVLYKEGWTGINYNDAEQSLIDSDQEDELKPWAGKIDEDSLNLWEKRDKVPEWCKGVARWYILSSRRNQILNKKDVIAFDETGIWPKQADRRNRCRGLLGISYNKIFGMTGGEYYAKYVKWPDSLDQEWRIAAEAFPCATNTFRMRHKGVVNIPKPGYSSTTGCKTLHPLRDLFIAGVGKMILGCDASGLELRMLAHYMADKIYQEVILSGDIHSYNMELAGISKRDIAKTFIYAFLYGSGIRNLSKVCGVSYSKMKKIIENFKRELPALNDLIIRIEKQGKLNRYLIAPDGRRGRIRSSNNKLLVHTMLNVLLQMTGSICMKYSLCFAESEMLKQEVGLDENGWPAWVANQHDEVQMEVPESEVEVTDYRLTLEEMKNDEKEPYICKDGKLWSAPRVMGDETEGGILIQRYYHPAGQIIAESMTKAGEFLKLRCPTAGEYKIGKSWVETH